MMIRHLISYGDWDHRRRHDRQKPLLHCTWKAQVVVHQSRARVEPGAMALSRRRLRDVVHTLRLKATRRL